IIEPRSTAFSRNVTYVFNPSEPKFECATALVFRFKQGPLLGICSDSPPKSEPNKTGYWVGHNGESFSLGVKDSSGTITRLWDGGGYGGLPTRISVDPGKGLVLTEEFQAAASIQNQRIQV